MSRIYKKNVVYSDSNKIGKQLFWRSHRRKKDYVFKNNSKWIIQDRWNMWFKGEEDYNVMRRK
jgi:hypothetical protein